MIHYCISLAQNYHTSSKIFRHHWFSKGLVTRLVLSHYLNQWWLFVNCGSWGINFIDISINKHKFSVNKNSFNSLWFGDAIWRHISGWTVAPVMACCLTAPSHYLNQCSTNHQWGLVAFTWEQFHRKCSRYLCLKWTSKLLIKDCSCNYQGPMS